MTKAELHQHVFKKYEEAHHHAPVSSKAVAQWAVDNGLLTLPIIDPLEALAEQVSRSLREETETDAHGRKVRVNHAVRYSKNGAQITMWGIMGFAPENHMEMSFTQRREQIIGDCHQLKTDVDFYNDSRPGSAPYNLVLDFTDDVAEREVSF